MNYRIPYYLVMLLVMLLGLGHSSICAKSNYQFDKVNSVTTVTKAVNSQTIKLGRNSTLKIKGGKFRNCRIQGNNTTIEYNGDQVVFENCTFTGSFINSSLKATNFGCKSDMTTRDIVWKSKDGKKVKTKQRQGFNNKTALESIAQFCTGSTNVSIEFNGAFFTPVIDNVPGRSEGTGNYLVIKSANGITMSGGTLIQGIYFVNCSNVHLSNISFVGLHEVHDFPPLFYQKTSFTNTKGEFYQDIKKDGFTLQNTANVVNDQYQSLGIAGASSLKFYTENGGQSKNILVEGCKFKMRNGGIGTGQKSARCNISDVVIRDCEFSHIYFQSLGLTSVSRITVDNVRSDYCLQGVDIDRWVNHLTVKNSTFLNCYTGPKQQLVLKNKSDNVDSYDNCFDNCYIQITDRIKFVDLVPYIFLVGQGDIGKSFTIKNCTFDIHSTSMPVEGFICRNSILDLENVTVNLYCSTKREKSDIPRLFNTGGSLMLGANYTPQINLNNVRFNITGGRIGYIASPAGPKYELNLNNVIISGKASCVYPAFANLSKLTMSGTTIDIECKSSLIDKIPSVKLNNTRCLNVKGMVYNSGGLKDDLSVSFHDSEFNCKGRFLNLYQAQKAQVDIQNNKVSCGTMVNFSDDPANLSLKLLNNSVNVSGNEVFSGVAKAKRSFVPSRVTVTGNTFNARSRASLYDNAASSSARSVFSKGSNSINLR